MAWGTKWEHVECPVLTFMLIRNTLLCHQPSLLEATDSEGYTCLHLAVISGNRWARHTSSNTCHTSSNFTLQPYCPQHLITWSWRSCTRCVIEFLLSRGANLRALDYEVASDGACCSTCSTRGTVWCTGRWSVARPTCWTCWWRKGRSQALLIFMVGRYSVHDKITLSNCTRPLDESMFTSFLFS